MVAKDILCTLVASENCDNCRGVARVLGIDRRNIKKGMERCILLDNKKGAFWINYL
jgi:hypothetical protein